MSSGDTVTAYIIETQIAIFDDARHDLQLTLGEIAKQARVPKPTVDAWAQGRNCLSLWGVKKLLRVKGLAPLLSRLFEPEQHALVPVAPSDHDELAGNCIDFAAEHARARHPNSPAGVNIAPCEDQTLRGKAVLVRAG